jgi:hypothetical protein
MIKKKTKSLNDSTNGNTGTKNPVLSFLGWNDKHSKVKKEIVKAYADEMPEYFINNPDALTIDSYLVHRRIKKKDCHDEWLNMYDFYKSAVQISKQIIAERRETGATSGKLIPNSVWKLQHMYDSQYYENVTLHHINSQRLIKETEVNSKPNLTIDCTSHPAFTVFIENEEFFNNCLKLKDKIRELMEQHDIS